MRSIRYVGAAVLAFMVGLVPAGPASAHGGPVTVDVAGDGAGGVTVLATYQQDRHPVDETINLVLVATGESGRKVGPIQLRPTAEGRGFYATGDVLTPGAWQVTVTASQPSPVNVTVKVDARVAQTAPPAQADSGLRRDQARSGRPGWWWVVGAAAITVLVAAGAFVLRRRRPNGAAGSL